MYEDIYLEHAFELSNSNMSEIFGCLIKHRNFIENEREFAYFLSINDTLRLYHNQQGGMAILFRATNAENQKKISISRLMNSFVKDNRQFVDDVATGHNDHTSRFRATRCLTIACII